MPGLPAARHSPVRLSPLGERLDSPAISRLMAAALEQKSLLSLAAGFTDNATLPVELVREVVAELTHSGAPPEYLQYGSTPGRPGLRAEIALRVQRQDGRTGRPLTPEMVTVTTGSQQAMHLALQTLCAPGDLVLVERPTYFVFLEACRGLGVETRSLPTAEDGTIDGAALAALLGTLRAAGELPRLKAVYLVSYHSNPSSRSLDVVAKCALARVLRAGGADVAILEDAAYRELAFDGATGAPSVLGLPEFDPFPRLYLGTFSKPFATGLKVGFGLCDDRPWREKMAHLKGHTDFGTCNFAQAIVERVLAGPRFDTCLARLRATYADKAAHFDAALRRAGLEALGWHWERPRGGLFFWLRAPEGVEGGFGTELFERGLREGVLYVPGGLAFAEGAPGNYVRLSFGVLDAAQLDEAVQRFTRAAAAATELAAGRRGFALAGA